MPLLLWIEARLPCKMQKWKWSHSWCVMWQYTSYISIFHLVRWHIQRFLGGTDRLLQPFFFFFFFLETRSYSTVFKLTLSTCKANFCQVRIWQGNQVSSEELWFIFTPWNSHRVTQWHHVNMDIFHTLNSFPLSSLFYTFPLNCVLNLFPQQGVFHF